MFTITWNRNRWSYHEFDSWCFQILELSQDWEWSKLVSLLIKLLVLFGDSRIIQYYKITTKLSSLLPRIISSLSLFFPNVEDEPRGLVEKIWCLQSRQKACHSNASERKVWVWRQSDIVVIPVAFWVNANSCIKPVWLARDPPVCLVREKVSLTTITKNARTWWVWQCRYTSGSLRGVSLIWSWLCSRTSLVDSTVGWISL